MPKEISTAVIKRLPRYYRFLGELLEHDITRISSNELSEMMNITASQIRQDLNNFGGFGQQGYGYNVLYLYTEIGKLLGLQNKFHMIIIGAGNLGTAIANYTHFGQCGFVIKAIFDNNDSVVGSMVGNLTVKHIHELEDFLKENEIQIAILTVPKDAAKTTALDVSKWGVKGIWNFSPFDLEVPNDIIVENVQLLDSLMTLSYHINDRGKQ